MQPCKRPRTCRVTNTPQRSAKIPSRGIEPKSLRLETASTTAARASCRAARRPSSERDSILRLLAGFQHPKASALLDAVVDVAPEAPEILPAKHHPADPHQPHQKDPDRLPQNLS